MTPVLKIFWMIEWYSSQNFPIFCVIDDLMFWMNSSCFSHQVKERPDVGVYVKDLSAFVVNNADDMDRIMTLGNKNSKLSPFKG